MAAARVNNLLGFDPHVSTLFMGESHHLIYPPSHMDTIRHSELWKTLSQSKPPFLSYWHFCWSSYHVSMSCWRHASRLPWHQAMTGAPPRCPGFSLLTVAWVLNGRELDGIRQAAGGAEANGNDGNAQRHRPLEQRGRVGWFGAKFPRILGGSHGRSSKMGNTHIWPRKRSDLQLTK